MQVTESKNEGLKREYAVTLDAKTINDQLEAELKSISGRVKIPGFRPGHIPLTVLKQRFGKDVMGEVLERSLNQSSQRIIKEKNLRPSMPPKVEVTGYAEGGDLSYRMELEVMPDVTDMDFSSITLQRKISDVSEKEIEEAMERLAERNKTFTAREPAAKARSGDQVLIDFVGRVDGVAFEGGTAKGFALALGSNQFIQGFEEQLIGTSAGKEVLVKVTFPENYHKEDLAGKPAEFTVTVHEVREGNAAEVTDDFAKSMGFESLEAMKNAVREQFSTDYATASRAHMKKELFDILETRCTFPIPEGMQQAEFQSIWQKIEEARKSGEEDFDGKSESQLREEYQKIADRRVKLGILLSDVAFKNKIQVNQDELSQAVMRQASQFPGQERKVFEFYQKNPQHLEELRGPILEEKAVDYILSQASIEERKVDVEELMREDNSLPSATEEKPKKEKKTTKKAANG